MFTVSLRSPDNLVYTPGSSDPTVRYTQLSTDLLPLAGYTVSSTLAGDWAVIVEANDRTLVEGIPVAVMGSLQSDLRLTPQIIDAPVSIGDSVTIAARLSSAADPLLGATLTGLLEVPGGSSMVITLRDDGRSGDGTAGDGVYGYRFTPAVPGVYSAVLSAAATEQNPAGRSALWVINVEGHRVVLPLIRR